MKPDDFETGWIIGVKATAFAASGAAGAAAAFEDWRTAIALGLMSGVCGVAGAMYYRASQSESVGADLIISVVMAFVLGVALGPTLGEWIARELITWMHLNIGFVERRMLGGALAGLSMTPILRAAMAGGKRLGEAIDRRSGERKP